MRVGIVPVEEDALRLVQRNRHFSKTDSSGFDQSDEEVRDTSYGRKEQGNDTQKKNVPFEDQEKEGEKVERNLVQDSL